VARGFWDGVGNVGRMDWCHLRGFLCKKTLILLLRKRREKKQRDNNTLGKNEKIKCSSDRVVY
jgi:hypothetical protein